MKKIKLIIPATCCLLATSLFSCAKNAEQPVSNFYKISIVNAAKGPTEKPSITFVDSNFIEKGKDCDVRVRFEDYYELSPLDNDPNELYRIRKSNFLSEGDILTTGHEITATDDPCVYKIHIDKEYMTTSYDVVVNCSYVDGAYHQDNIECKNGSKLDDMTNIYITNTSARCDLTFILMPKDFQAGYTFDDKTKAAIEVYGIPEAGGEENLTEHLTRNELIRCDSPVQGISHYFTNAESLRLALPVDKLYERVEPSKTFVYGYKPKFASIEIRSTKDDAPVTYDKEHYKSVFNPTVDSISCSLESTPDIIFNETGVHYNATFKAKDGYSFPTASSQDDFAITDLTVLPKTYNPTGRPYFRSLALHSNESLTPYKAYTGSYSLSVGRNVFEDANGNTYYAMNDYEDALYNVYPGWLKLTHTDNKTLKVDINITNLVKYVELPITTIFTEFDAATYGYQDGSIDFIQSFNFTIKAYQA